MDYRKHNQTEPWDDGVYGTGRTEPPKNNNGMIALLLMLIIFLSGIVSVLSFWNIRLFHQLQQVQQQADSIPFAFSGTEVDATGEDTMLEAALHPTHTAHIPLLGIHGEYVSRFDQHYFSWPAGMIITDVDEDSQAALLGLEAGDIIVSLNEAPITCQEELDKFLKDLGPGEAFRLVVFREGAQYTFDTNNTK